VALAAGAALVLTLGDRPRQEVQARQFQQLVGGLGCGPAVDLSTCAFSFDPRLCPACPQDHGPIAGGAFFCPHHACSILPCRPVSGGAIFGERQP
jgi:hypothetical protein